MKTVEAIEILKRVESKLEGDELKALRNVCHTALQTTLEPDFPDWISTKYEVPAENGYYLVVVKTTAPEELGGNKIEVKRMRWHDCGWRYPVHYPEWINDEIDHFVTHWMPLPELPEVE